MQIALIVDSYLPDTKAAAKLTSDLASELVRLGHSVAVLTVSDAIRNQCEVERNGSLTLLRARTGRIKGASRVVRAFNEMRLSSVMWHSLSPELRRMKADLVVCYSPSIFFGPLVSRLKKLWGARSYLVLRDIFPDWAVDAGLLRKGLVYRYFKHCEMRNYAAADRIGVESTANLAYFRTIDGEHRHQVEVLYSWTTGQRQERLQSGYRERLGLQDKVVFFFGGNIGVAQDMDNLLQLARELRAVPQAHLLFVGDGSEVDRIRKILAQDALPNVTLHPPVAQAEYSLMLREFDVGLISLDRRLKSANIPGKMLGYMECGLPILASVNPVNELLTQLNESGAGLASLNGDRQQFCRDALSLAGDASLREKMGRQSRALLEQRFHVRAAARQILDLLPAGCPADEQVPLSISHPGMRADLS